ncbi:guanylate kinase [Latilactobacillus graminis]|uniref:Guanylate kinase n=1 Tax=Latilactobacillus graminis TaxID=60519 RepID=A0ABX6CB13_9LACO|nr:guanylate kinase [Latilactobacillus graminis]
MVKQLLVITGATGSGKTTVSHYLKTAFQIPQVVTHTTRPRRHNEVDGVDYYFETPTTLAQKHLIESVTYSGYQYGSSYEALDLAWQKAPLISLVVDTQGAQTYLEVFPKIVSVLFLTVSESQSLITRLEKRKDRPEAIQKRITSAEFKRDLILPPTLNQQATVLRNDDWESTKQALAALIATFRN